MLNSGNGEDADGNSIRLSKEIDIVEAGNAITRSHRSMEFDIVELGNVGTIVKFVVTAIRLRHCKR